MSADFTALRDGVLSRVQLLVHLLLLILLLLLLLLLLNRFFALNGVSIFILLLSHLLLIGIGQFLSVRIPDELAHDILLFGF